MQHINYKSDFKLNLTVKPLAGGDTLNMSLYDFKVDTWCGGKKFTATHEGTVYTNCKWDTDNQQVIIIYDNHALLCGRMRIEVSIKTPDTDMGDATWLKCNVLYPDVYLVDGNGGYTAEASVVIDYAVIDAYTMAVAAGYTGTKEEYIAALLVLPAAVTSANNAVTEAEEAVTDANTAIDKANTAADKADTAASKADTAVKNASDTETNIETAEALRVTAERNRVAKENERVTAESERSAAETTRNTSETARIEEEKKRVSAETLRKTAETDRATSEQQRAASETARGNAEDERNTKETERIANENTRISNETARGNAEAARVVEFGSLKSASESATIDAKQATTDATAKITECDAKLVEMNDTIDEFKIVIKETVNISLSSNQNIDLTGKKIYIKKVSDNTILYTLTWAGSTLTQDVEVDEAYYVEAEAVAGYNTPKSDSYTAVSGNSRDVALRYETEKVTIHLSAYDGASVANQIITTVINSVQTQYTWDGNDIVLLVPFGQSIVVYCDKKSGYSAPALVERTSSQAAFAANMVYGESKLQVGIVDKDGNVFSASEWDTANNANVAGFKIVTGNIDIIMSPDYTSSQYGAGNLIDGVVTSTSNGVAILDYAGKADTDALVAASGNSAADWCRNYDWKLSGKTGYLPALGELYEILVNFDAINECRTACGLDALPSNRQFWSATQYSAANAWNCYSVSLRVDFIGKITTDRFVYVFAVCAS